MSTASLSTSTPDLAVESTVPRSLVHKAAIHEVLIADSKEVGEYEYACSGQLPRAHRFYNDSLGGYHDPLAILEAARQAGVLVAHRHLNVPAGHQFIFRWLALDVDDVEALALRSAPSPYALVLRFDDPKERRGQLVGGRMMATVAVDDRPAMRLRGEVAFISRAVYAKFRRTLVPPAAGTVPAVRRASPERVGRREPSNVVISGDSGPARAGEWSATVLVDQTHPTLFDHPLDHVPGMLLVEAMRQTAAAAMTGERGLESGAAVVTAAAIEYVNIAELDTPVECVARKSGERDEDGGTEFEVRLTQASEDVTRGRLTMRACEELGLPAT